MPCSCRRRHGIARSAPKHLEFLNYIVDFHENISKLLNGRLPNSEPAPRSCEDLLLQHIGISLLGISASLISIEQVYRQVLCPSKRRGNDGVDGVRDRPIAGQVKECAPLARSWRTLLNCIVEVNDVIFDMLVATALLV
jgi:hypothetical protein